MRRHTPHVPNEDLIIVHCLGATKFVVAQLRRDLAADLRSDGNSGIVAIRSDVFGRNEAVHVDQWKLGARVGEEEGLMAGVKTDEGGEEGEGAGGQVHNVMRECFRRS